MVYDVYSPQSMQLDIRPAHLWLSGVNHYDTWVESCGTKHTIMVVRHCCRHRRRRHIHHWCFRRRLMSSYSTLEWNAT